MIASGQFLPDRLGRTILEQDTGVIAEHRVSDGRLDTNTCGASGNDQILRAELFQDRVQLRLVEAAEPMFV